MAYARVSSHDQKDDLERQKQVLELYCAQQGWTFELISDLGSGMNYHKKGYGYIARSWEPKSNAEPLQTPSTSIPCRANHPLRCS